MRQSSGLFLQFSAQAICFFNVLILRAENIFTVITNIVKYHYVYNCFVSYFFTFAKI